MIYYMIRKHTRKPSFREVHSLNSLSYTHISFAGMAELEEKELEDEDE